MACDGMYSKLIDDEAGAYDNVNHRGADVGLGGKDLLNETAVFFEEDLKPLVCFIPVSV